MAIFTLELLEEIILEEVKSGKVAGVLTELDSATRTNRIVLIHVKHGHFKYYVIDEFLKENKARVLWGRIGYSPQTTVYDLQKGRDRKREKLRKGYEEISPETYKELFSKHGNLVV